MAAIRIRILKDSLEQDVKFWLVYDVFAHITQVLTGTTDSFYSEFYGNTENGYDSDGCGALFALTTGGNLRGLDITPSITLKEMLEWASATHGVGWGYENTGSGYRLRVELMEHFYSGGEIFDLTGRVKKGSYKESGYQELEINKVDIGYKKYSDEIAINSTYEDFLTKSQYSLPVKTTEGTYTRLSPFIASNDLIQATYDRVGSSEKWKFDQDVFVIALARDYENGGFIPENDENFDVVNGLDDSATAYNIRISPIQMFLNQSLLINSSLFRLPIEANIQNTEAIINQEFSAQFSSSDSCRLADEQRILRASTGNMSIYANYYGNRLWNPVMIEVEASLTTSEVNDIVDAMEGNNIDANKNYGYITNTDEDGVVKQLYPLDLRWKPKSKIVKIQGLEKADNYGV